MIISLLLTIEFFWEAWISFVYLLIVNKFVRNWKFSSIHFGKLQVIFLSQPFKKRFILFFAGPHIVHKSFRSEQDDGSTTLHTSTTATTAAAAALTHSGFPDRPQAKISPVPGSNVQLSVEVQPLHLPDDWADQAGGRLWGLRLRLPRSLQRQGSNFMSCASRPK